MSGPFFQLVGAEHSLQVFGIKLVGVNAATGRKLLLTAVAGYFVILRGTLFNVGDRIIMGGVRRDVISLGYVRATVMEMGQAPEEQGDDPSMWVQARQYTGRIVTVANDKIFDEPIYNYTRGFPHLWGVLPGYETALPPLCWTSRVWRSIVGRAGGLRSHERPSGISRCPGVGSLRSGGDPKA